MAEYPTRNCGPCPHIAHFEKRDPPRDYLTSNTVPSPNVVTSPNQNFQEHNLGVPKTLQSPDLTKSPIELKNKQQNERYQGGIPPCQTPEPDGTCCMTVKTVPEQEPCPITPYDLPKPVCQEKKVHPRKGILKRSVQQESPDMFATAGRTHPDQPDPATLPPSAVNEVQGISEPCYLPQPQDAIPEQLSSEMGPVGPWATGRVDWGPMSGLTGTRPVVDKYSIARYSEGDWRAHNKEILDMASTELYKATLIDWNGRQCLEQTQSDIDKNQEDNTKRLQQRSLELHRWKCELERSIAAAGEEITLLEEQRVRLKSAGNVLLLPESIAGECLERRTGRLDSELVRDDVEEECIKELALCSEIRDIFIRTMKDVEKQLLEDKTAKQRLEFDWSDKTIANEREGICVALNSRSTILMFKPGAVTCPDNQSSPEYWEHFTRETLMEGEATRQRSAALRGTLDAILNNAARDLRTQADKVEMALSKRVACMEEVHSRLDSDLKKILQRLADIESTIMAFRNAIRRLDIAMKITQTRLEFRLQRPRVENCRDEAHFGLLEEVKNLGENVAQLQAQLRQAEQSQANLMKGRSDLEQEIMLKLKSLQIDRERIQLIRSHYPSAAALSGY